ncbi:MAG: hypothetical protein V7742_13985 [Halioglobus sp.]
MTVPTGDLIGTAKTDETRFGGFVTMFPAYFWQSIPETPKQPDALDGPDGPDGPDANRAL